MNDITAEKLEEEKTILKGLDVMQIIESIRKSIEVLIALKMDDD